jgi:tetraacyldisaccharide 4'-kinase
VIVAALSAAYGAVATWRRRWYAQSPERQYRLTQPVISVGNLRVGGSGKTPATAHIARVLLDRGERPVILSRGYARQQANAGVTVVSDRSRVLTDVAHAGDEPFLLARMLPGVPVLVCANRYHAGLEAEARFSASVHVLDDGFQHVKLARDIDLLLVDADDLADRVLPAGRLREPLANASIADAVITPGVDRDTARSIAVNLGVADAFVMTRTLGSAVLLSGTGALPHATSVSTVAGLATNAPVFGIAGLATDTPVFAIAGIARPERFFDDLRAAGLRVCGTQAFPDHHQFSRQDIVGIVDAARAHGAAAVVTTEKDAVRLGSLDTSALPFAAVPLAARIEPAEEFGTWVTERLVRAREGRSAVRP